MLTTIRRPASQNVVRAGQTGIRSEFRFVGVQVPSWENGAQADSLCGTVRHGQITGADRVIVRPPAFLANKTVQGADTFRIDLFQDSADVSPSTTLQIAETSGVCSVLHAS